VSNSVLRRATLAGQPLTEYRARGARALPCMFAVAIVNATEGSVMAMLIG
jgi:hypothetical protein